MSDTPKTRWVVPMSAPDLTPDERRSVAEVLNTRWLSMGPQIAAFEQSVADYVGARHAVAVNTGTAALHLCVRAAGVQDGDLVITTPFSFVASTNAILYERAIPVFVDVDPATGNIDPEAAAAAASDLNQAKGARQARLPRRGTSSAGRLRAMLAVDVFGQPADFDGLNAAASAHGLAVIEDSAEAIGSTYKGRPAGTLGDAGVFAFYPNKQLTTGEGGMVVTDHDDWADSIRALRNQGRAVGDTWLEHSLLGYNYRLPEISASLGLAQMRRLDELLQARQRVADWYGQALEGAEGIQLPTLAAETTRMGWFVYVIRLREGIDRAQVMSRLVDRGIPSRPYFPPIHLQPYMRERFGYRPGDFPVAEDLGARGLALPFSGIMSEEQVGIVAEAVIGAIAA